MTTDNPFFAPSDLPYQLPPFDRIEIGHYLPAFERGMADQRAEVAAIAADPAPPTFENTLVALERSGRILQRVSAAFFNLASSDTSPQLQEIEKAVVPQLSAHSDAIMLDRGLYGRVRELYERRAELGLDAEPAWLLERYHTDFVRAGAQLSDEQHVRLRELNAELAGLATEFGNKVRDEMNASAVVVDDVAELDGLSDDAIAAAAQAARDRGLERGYVLNLILPTAQPQLASLTDRALRERLHTASVTRGGRGDEHDTTGLVRRIVRLRAERARLLGFEHHAEYNIADNTARTVQAVEEMLAKLAPAAVANALAEAEDLQAAIAAAGETFTLEPWDWAFYTERVRRERYAIDEAELRPYFELERVLRDGVFYAAGRLYGLRFEERPDLPAYHPDARVFEVLDHDGSPLGLFVGDFFTRASKRGGAWANALVPQSRLFGTAPVVVNNLNINRAPAGEPTLLTLDEVRTLFHEFGHALHTLFSQVHFPKFAGTRVPRDFVEYPSQVNEVWMLWPEVLANYATHHETGAPLPQEIVDRLQAAKQFNEGFATTEYLAASLLDLAWHTLRVEDAEDVDVAAFEAAALERAGVAVPFVPPRYRTPYFAHIFSGAAYSAGYYSYIWSEVLDADTVDWLTEQGGLRRELGDTFRDGLLARGGSADSMAVYRAFRGRDPLIEPLLKRRGLTANP
ncbi:M3 family metallopeptidase [Dactylosporangium sp. AC04546]|uniref:M3 family metallopeptidase n=1 Tax=Dactylosporangium sp. AC04546 TaxID=2862460 RepID=UPI001EDD09BE|nr:M3 family metallopeptidase [Dactylosporangium sp. AC04546]WVK82436.1 M3 family metallopeptidase [Dactylosporangium sp. AC04546]